MSQTRTAELVVMGGGNMARAIIRGTISARVIHPDNIVVCEPESPKRALLETLGVWATASHAQAMERLAPGGRVLLAVKPQSLSALAEQIRPLIASGRLVISILAGVRIETIESALGLSKGRVIRAMPNLPASVQLGMTALAVPTDTTSGDAAFVDSLFGAVGKTVRVSEELLDAFTALSGSGPAYVFYLAEAMEKAAVRAGFAPPEAGQIVRQTLLGASTLLAGSAEAPAALRAAVTSKGGTTEAAVSVLEREGVMGAVVDAILAARDRGRALGS